MQSNINEAQKKRKQDALFSAVLFSLLAAATGCMMLCLRHIYLRGTFLGAVLLIIGILDVGSVIPIWINLKVRFREIEGGEEDAAAQY